MSTALLVLIILVCVGVGGYLLFNLGMLLFSSLFLRVLSKNIKKEKK